MTRDEIVQALEAAGVENAEEGMSNPYRCTVDNMLTVLGILGVVTIDPPAPPAEEPAAEGEAAAAQPEMAEAEADDDGGGRGRRGRHR